MILRMPPRIKVLEAAGAIADGRVEVVDDKRARVTSSEGDRVYTVYVDLARREAYSNDNGTIYRGYIGYPIIAFLMKKGVIYYDEKVGKALEGIPWRRLNEKYKKYALVEEEVKKHASTKGVQPQQLEAFTRKVLSQLSTLRLRRLQQPPFKPIENTTKQ